MTTIDVEGGEASDGVMTLVVTVVELLVDALEREAIRRMEAGSLTDEEVDRLGHHLAEIEAEIETLKRERGIEDGVATLRGDLDGLVSDAIEGLEDDARSTRRPGYSVFGGEKR